MCIRDREVTFRGCIDSHVHHEGDRHGVLSAIWVSALWSWWHMGCLPGTNPLNVLVLMIPTGIISTSTLSGFVPGRHPMCHQLQSAETQMAESTPCRSPSCWTCESMHPRKVTS